MNRFEELPSISASFEDLLERTARSVGGRGEVADSFSVVDDDGAEGICVFSSIGATRTSVQPFEVLYCFNNERFSGYFILRRGTYLYNVHRQCIKKLMREEEREFLSRGFDLEDRIMPMELNVLVRT